MADRVRESPPDRTETTMVTRTPSQASASDGQPDRAPLIGEFDFEHVFRNESLSRLKLATQQFPLRPNLPIRPMSEGSLEAHFVPQESP